jgi:hypothetical protein
MLAYATSFNNVGSSPTPPHAGMFKLQETWLDIFSACSVDGKWKVSMCMD